MAIVVITGATSFLGAALTRELLNQGHICHVIVRPDSPRLSMLPMDNEHLFVHMHDLHSVEVWQKVIGHCDLFYHLAWGGIGALGRANPEIQADNVRMTQKCLQSAYEMGAKRFVFAGSQAEYGVNDNLVSETTPCHPTIEYGKGKLQVLLSCSEQAKQLGIEYVHLRIFSVYGENDHPWTLVSSCISAFIQEEELPLSSCEQLWNFLHVNDAAHAMYLMGVSPLMSEDPVYNIASTDTRKLREFVDIIWYTADCKGHPAYGTRGSTLEKPHGIQPSIEKMRIATGFKPSISFEDGIRQMIESAKSKQQ